MLLILSTAHDPVVERVTAELARRGASFVVLNPPADGLQSKLRCALRGRGSWIRVGEADIDLDQVSGVWMWRTGSPVGDGKRAVARFGRATAASYVERDWMRVVTDALQARERRWIPATAAAMDQADNKLLQLAVAERLGFAVPETLVSNDVGEVLAFVADCGGDVIAKAPSVTLSEQLARPGLAVYTRTLRPRDWAAIEALEHAPVMLQRRIPKRVELRVTVVGERVFAAEIHSQATRRTRVDWRQYDHAHTPMEVHALPAAVEARCVAMTRTLGLGYGAIDLVVTPAAEYVFLEINPNGQWTWVEERTGLPITAALCDQLLAPERTA